jgi:hypothetical protein
MNIFNPIISGAVRSIKSIKGILAIWLSSLFLVSMVALPMKNSFNNALGTSMITEKLTESILMFLLIWGLSWGQSYRLWVPGYCF